MSKGGFTLPGEAGYEELTLQLAKKWGADVIRDSDGTRLSEEILKMGYEIYSTICIIRDHNEWAKNHKDKLQQTFLITEPKVAVGEQITIDLMHDFFSEQFEINASQEAMQYWQVYDRTTNEVVETKRWAYEEETNCVTIKSCIQWHKYTVSFLCYRIWEEISMYNHTTNQWNKEHLMQIDPIHDETRCYLKKWLQNWCEDHPDTNVVRFTSMFYNFAWIWGSDPKKQTIFSDWGSYDFSVSPAMLARFEDTYGYRLTAEDFVNQGKYQVTHMPPTKAKLDYMELVIDFVVSFGKELVDLVHQYGKKAYVFYDDSWIGVEPYHKKFQAFGFDGLIKCVFSGYEARLCAGVSVPVHELRLHPYLFPVGLGGTPTFQAGGKPEEDAKQYWSHIRRALLRQPVDRIGLGGYLHMVQEYPAFCDYIEQLTKEFHSIKTIHEQGKPYTFPCKIAVLHRWGSLRSWTLSGHFHETYMHTLIHVNEALSGMPVLVDFIGFDQVREGKLKEYQIVINVGHAGDAWSGGEVWKEPLIVDQMTKWVANGGVFFGINEPSATDGGDTFFHMAHVLGVDLDRGARVCHGKWKFELVQDSTFVNHGVTIHGKEGIYLVDSYAKVYAQEKGVPTVVVHPFERGFGIYLADFTFSFANTRFLLNLLLKYSGNSTTEYLTENEDTECAYYPDTKKLVIINPTEQIQETKVRIGDDNYHAILEPYGMCILDVKEGENR